MGITARTFDIRISTYMLDACLLGIYAVGHEKRSNQAICPDPSVPPAGTCQPPSPPHRNRPSVGPISTVPCSFASTGNINNHAQEAGQCCHQSKDESVTTSEKGKE